MTPMGVACNGDATGGRSRIRLGPVAPEPLPGLRLMPEQLQIPGASRAEGPGPALAGSGLGEGGVVDGWRHGRVLGRPCRVLGAAREFNAGPAVCQIG